MSQNKTVFPGLGQEGDFNPNQSFSGGEQPYSRPFSQSHNKGTVYPGMGVPNNGGAAAPRDSRQAQPTRGNGKPIVGFLYSISRTGVGEFWPLHIGQNIIGNSPECDIILGEGTVSQKHANLHINRMKKPEKTEATISDLGSTNGTLVNENSVSVARPVECGNGDIITIGENYDLLLLLIDTKALGLHLSESFYDVREEQEDFYRGGGSSTKRDNTTRNERDFPPRFDPTSTIHPAAYDPGNRPTDSTVGMDSTGGFNSGGTVGMD